MEQIDSGHTSAEPATLNIPAGTAAGSYYILAVADGPAIPTGSGVVAETVENNNTTAKTFRITP